MGDRAGGETSARRNNDSAEKKEIKIKKVTLRSLKEEAGIRGGRKSGKLCGSENNQRFPAKGVPGNRRTDNLINA